MKIALLPRHCLYSGPVRRRMLLALVLVLLAPAAAQADTSSTLTVVGTSDVADSGLVPNVLQPAFNKAYPQYTFKYIGTATGTAISDAETGSVGASALIVHAASLENQFVAQGYSAERYGRAIFTNDFVLAGNTSDPAGVGANGANNVAQAFADIASAGAAGRATFVSRGGTPGTTVEEHKLWALVLSANLAPSSLLLCQVNGTNGGGDTPIAPGNGVTANGQSCPNGGALPKGSQLPAWYVATGLTQGPNVVAANSCNFANGSGSCYVLTDRGTYDYLASGTDPAGAVPNLKIVTRDDSASAPGGADALINYFHSYIINPDKPGETVNRPAATAWADFLTAPSTQRLVAAYLGHTSDPGGAPFTPSASPLLSAPHGLPRAYRAGRPVTVTGTVTNAETGYPALNGVTVTISEVTGSLTVPVASGRTNAQGSYAIRFTPSATGSYVISTAQIARIEDSTLSPAFGDLLSPAATTPLKVTVHSAVTSLRVTTGAGGALLLGSVAPGLDHVHATVTIQGRTGGHGRYRTLAIDRLAAGDASFAVSVPATAGHWRFRARYADPGQVVGSSSRTVGGAVGPRPAVAIAVHSVRIVSGRATVAGRLSAAGGGRRVSLLGLRTASTGARLVTLGRATVRGRTFTVHGRLRRGFRWVLVLTAGSGAATVSSPTRTVDVR